MNNELCKNVYERVYGKSCLNEKIPFEQWIEILEEIKETLNFSRFVSNYPAIHLIPMQLDWKAIAIDEEDGWQDLTWCIADIFGFNNDHGIIKGTSLFSEGSPVPFVRELANMLDMPIAVDYGDNGGYHRTDVEEDW